MSDRTQHGTPNSPLSNIVLIEQLFDAWNSHDVESIVSHYGSGFDGVDNAVGDRISGRPGARRVVEGVLAAFPDYEIEAQQMIPGGDHVTVIWNANGTHRGELLSVPPTGRSVTMSGVTIYTVAAGHVIQSQTLWDVAGWLRQIGLLPRLRQSC